MQAFGCLVFWKLDFCMFHLEKIYDEKESERGGIRIIDNVIFKIPLHFDKYFEIVFFFFTF